TRAGTCTDLASCPDCCGYPVHRTHAARARCTRAAGRRLLGINAQAGVAHLSGFIRGVYINGGHELVPVVASGILDNLAYVPGPTPGITESEELFSAGFWAGLHVVIFIKVIIQVSTEVRNIFQIVEHLF